MPADERDGRDEDSLLDEGQTEAAARDVDEPVISLRDVHVAYDRPILKGVSFDLSPGTTKILLGGSGSGKSTILRLLLGLLKADSGSIVVDGTEVTGLSEEELRDVRLKIGMVFQEGALFDSLTVAENVGYKLYEETKLPHDQVRQRVEEVLGFIGLAEFIDRMPSELSGGQRRRVAIARAMAAKPRILLYDEPTTGLDPVTSAVIDELMMRMRQQLGVTSVVITHDMRSAYTVGQRIAMLYEGRVRQVGTVEEIRNTRDPVVRQFIEGRATLNGDVEMAGVPAARG
jgi:phospholipid/cholesterol/gamma-HCH transport system ATP-binding protein